jgi:hypothetical protein
MTSTHFRDDHAEIVKHNALGYAQEAKDKPFRLSVTNFDTVGATSLHTTVEDLERWDENFYHPQVGDQAFVEQMLERGKLNSGEQLDYAFGLVVGKYKGLPTVDHAGGDAGYRSDMTRFPEQHFSAAVLCNSAETNPTRLVRQVADILLAKDFKESEQAPMPASPKAGEARLTGEQMAALTGLYWNREDDDFHKIMVKDGRLQINFGGEDSHVLKAAKDMVFRIVDASRGDEVEIRFLPATSDKPQRMQQSVGREKPKLYESVAPFNPNAEELAEYSGAYFSEEIDPVYTIVIEDGSLRLVRMKHQPETLQPTMRDVFSGDIGTLHFTRDANHHISGLTLNTDRIRNFRFSKKIN